MENQELNPETKDSEILGQIFLLERDKREGREGRLLGETFRACPTPLH